MIELRRLTGSLLYSGNKARGCSVDRFFAQLVGTAIGVCEIQKRQSGDKHLFTICQLRLTLTDMHWHLYWMRSFDAWWPYPLPRQGRKHTLRARLQQVIEDEFGCFWG